MRKQVRRKRAQQRTCEATERKARSQSGLEKFLADLPEDMASLAREIVKRGRENWYRLTSAGANLKNDHELFYGIKRNVKNPEIAFVTLFYEGEAPACFPKGAPLWIYLKRPDAPLSEEDAAAAPWVVIPCPKWDQFCVAAVLFGDERARKEIADVLENQGITPITDEELEASRKAYGLFVDYLIEKQKANRNEVITADQAFTDWVKIRLFPESEPDKVQRIAIACGKTFDETVESIKSGHETRHSRGT